MEEKDLSKMTVATLRAEAKKYPEIKGISTMKKEKLLEVIFEARGESPDKKEKEPKDRKTKKREPEKTIGEIKKEIKLLKAEKSKAIVSKDNKLLGKLRRNIKRMKRLTKKISLAKT